MAWLAVARVIAAALERATVPQVEVQIALEAVTCRAAVAAIVTPSEAATAGTADRALARIAAAARRVWVRAAAVAVCLAAAVAAEEAAVDGAGRGRELQLGYGRENMTTNWTALISRSLCIGALCLTTAVGIAQDKPASVSTPASGEKP